MVWIEPEARIYYTGLLLVFMAGYFFIKLKFINEATQQIRESNKEVDIIAQTAYGQYGGREKSIESGCNDYLAKLVNFLSSHQI